MSQANQSNANVSPLHELLFGKSGAASASVVFPKTNEHLMDDFPHGGCVGSSFGPFDSSHETTLTREQFIKAIFGDTMRQAEARAAEAESETKVAPPLGETKVASLLDEAFAPAYSDRLISNMPDGEVTDEAIISVPGAIVFDGDDACESSAAVVLERHPNSGGLAIRIGDDGGNSVVFDSGTVTRLCGALQTLSAFAGFLHNTKGQ